MTSVNGNDWSTTGTMLWFVLFFVCLFYEAFAGIAGHKDHTPMLTQVVVRFIPWQFTIGFILWLLIHFSVRYANPAYRAWLASGGSGG